MRELINVSTKHLFPASLVVDQRLSALISKERNGSFELAVISVESSPWELLVEKGLVVGKTNDFETLECKMTHELVGRWYREGLFAEAQLAAAKMLEGNPDDLRAWHLLALAVSAGGDTSRARRAFRGLSEAYGRQGDLPMAIVTALECGEAGGKVRSILDELAAEISSHVVEPVDDWRPSPPAIPCSVEVDMSSAGDSDALMLSVDDALDIAERSQDDKKESRRYFFPLLSSLSPEVLTRFAEKLRVERRDAGSIIIEQGEPGESFYIVAKGQVHIERRDSAGGENLLARLGAGAFFGEMAIVTAAPRSARVVAESEVTLLRAAMDDVGAEMEESLELQEVLMAFCRARMLENIVQASPVLRRVPTSNRSDLLSRFAEAFHHEGDVIIEEGVESEGLFLLVSGDVEVTSSEQGDVLTIATLSSGDFFGEISVVLRRPAVATVTASSETVSLFLMRDAFLDVIRAHPTLLAELYETAIEREAETSSILAREAESADDLILL